MLRLIIGLLLFTTYAAPAQNPLCTQAISQVNTDSLMRFVRELTGKVPVSVSNVSTRIESRYATHPGNEVAAAFIMSKCAGYGFDVQTFSFSSTGKNIIATKYGSQFPGKSFMLCAHYDCVGNSSMRFHGADDNASGVAALLEAARVLKQIDFPYTVQLAFWDEEEAGLLGSKAYAPSGSGMTDVQALINIDMIAWDGNNDSLAMIHVYPFLGKTLQMADRVHDLNEKSGLHLKTFIKNPGDNNSDHYAFWLTGVPAIGLTEDYDNDFNPSWHQASDSIEKFNIPYFSDMSRLAIVTLCEMSSDGKFTPVIEETEDRNVIIYPNPASDRLYFRSDKMIEQVMLCDMFGRTVLQKHLAGVTSQMLDLPQELPDGIYTVIITGEGGSYKTQVQLTK